MTMRGNSVWAVAIGALFVGCAPMEGDAGEGVASQASPLLGAVTFNTSGGSDCGPYQGFLRSAMRRGRSIALSGAFSTCVRSAMAGHVALNGDPHASGRVQTDLGPYNFCAGDPASADPTGALLAFTRSNLDVAMTCTGATGAGIAFTTITSNPGTAERLTWREGRLLASVQSQDQNYAAAIIWHEAMHQHGYGHGSGRAESCGYGAGQFTDNDDGWMYRHTAPYIITSCMTYVGDISDTCPATCGANGVALRSALSPNAACVCVRDPGAPQWSPYVSDESGSPPTSCGSVPADGMACTGRYCDNVALRCPATPAVALGGASYWAQSFSDETSGGRTCNPGMYVAAVKCSGSYCDNVSLLCVQGARPWGSCAWTGSFSEEQGAGLCPAGTAMAGARCTGSYCDNVSLYCCRPY